MGINISEFVGKTFVRIVLTENKEEIRFGEDTGNIYRMFHPRDCCESVSVEDITGELDDLLFTPILHAEESSNQDDPHNGCEFYAGSHTWTFYRLRTMKGSVVIRWYGTSNGYYSESVSLVKI